MPDGGQVPTAAPTADFARMIANLTKIAAIFGWRPHHPRVKGSS